MLTTTEILNLLPYGPEFRFVDGLDEISETGVTGHFTFGETKGHFKDYPVTPGVLLIETMAQIGLACLGIYLSDNIENKSFAFTSSDVEFLLPVFPGEKVIVVSEKVYFRFGKLKCKVKMLNKEGKEVCSGTIAGMIITRPHA
jgi:3-hydroxyacyl-[acyl-carrier-protein] dehydratase